jgi:hypothetical protein
MKTELSPSRPLAAMSTTASSTAASTTPASISASTKNQEFEARRSNKATNAAVKADGATWKERLAVCEGVTDDGQPVLKIRSYYRNHLSRDRVWDEPPSGASEVVFATAEMRKHAEQQMKELQLTLDLIPPDFNSTNNNAVSNGGDSKPKGKIKNNGGIFGRFKRKDKEKPTLKDDSKDLNLQKAIARSMLEQHGGYVECDDEPVIYYDPEAGLDALADASSGGGLSMSATLRQIEQQEQDDMALAQALSMSAREAAASPMSEDEMLQRAIEASRFESLAVVVSDNLSPFDPYSPHAAKSSPTTSSSSSKKTPPPPAAPPVAGESSPPQKLEADQGLKNKPASRVFEGRKKMEVKAGVV